MTRRLGAILVATAVLAVAGYLTMLRRGGPVRIHGRKPNVVLIEVCSLRYDRLGCTGYDRPTSPMIDELAKGGVLFQRCISQSSWTKPSTASILTGLNPNVHNLTDSYDVAEITADGFMPKRALSPDIVTIAEALKQGGYQTAGFVANPNAWPAFGMSQGFDRYDHVYAWSGPELVQHFGEWLRGRDRKKPFFAFMLLFDVHHPYHPPYAFYEEFCRDKTRVPLLDYPSYQVHTNYPFLYSIKDRPDWAKVKPHQLEQWVDLYDGEVRVVDDAIRRAVEHLVKQGAGDDTAIIVVGDHGESLTEHGLTSHGNSLCEQLVHVPLVMHLPGLRGRQTVDRMVRSIDIYPTLCDYCGVRGGAHVQGQSLLPLLRGKKDAPTASFALSSTKVDRNAIQDDRWKLIKGSEVRLFDLRHDPGETRDVSVQNPRETARLQEELARALRKDEALRRKYGGASSRLDPETVRQLKGLGYLK